jgi:hypothetical protein
MRKEEMIKWINYLKGEVEGGRERKEEKRQTEEEEAEGGRGGRGLGKEEEINKWITII